MNTSSKQADPQVVAEWAKGPNEVVRVSLGKYRGQTIVHIRVWYRADDETFRPGRNGISLALAEHARKIRRALRKADEITKIGESERE
ncbi:transcriptional coactivator p15/PC4 family protein [Bradyrhizobium diazoefficiens]|uniref:transcriptional coactivator p15/PC4 family protein n=1 Tax=Bradyrhizobium diazoefficiens TaxID=1355477 RepID=UPI0038361FAC